MPDKLVAMVLQDHLRVTPTTLSLCPTMASGPLLPPFFLWSCPICCPMEASEFLPDPDASGLLRWRPEVRVSAQAAAHRSWAFKRGVREPMVPRRRGRQQITPPLILTCPAAWWKVAPKERMRTTPAPVVSTGKSPRPLRAELGISPERSMVSSQPRHWPLP